MAKRVFFSFHYQDVIDFRANVVRQCWVTKPDRGEAGFFDASLWEKSQRTGNDSLKKLINDGLNGTSFSAVLIGTETYIRPWVRYEIFKSLENGNGLIGVHINSISCKNKQTKSHGPDPFAYLAVKFRHNGAAVDPWEWDGQKWVSYGDVPGWSLSQPQLQLAGQMKPLSTWYKTHCWVTDDGYKNFASWIGE